MLPADVSEHPIGPETSVTDRGVDCYLYADCSVDWLLPADVSEHPIGPETSVTDRGVDWYLYADCSVDWLLPADVSEHPIGPETSVTSCQSTLRNSPEDLNWCKHGQCRDLTINLVQMCPHR